MTSPRHFLHRLEALRGLAAIAVVIHHAFMFIKYEPSIGRYYRGIEAIFYGHGAVLCFFVLSGYVLGQSLRRSQEFGSASYADFCLKRCYRILPAFVVSIFFSFSLFFLFNLGKFPSAASSHKYLDAYTFIPNFLALIQNLAFVRYQSNPVVWSLVPELICSFLLPLLHVFSKTAWTRMAVFVVLFSIWLLVPTSNPPLAASASYLWVFYVGYLIPLIPEKINAFLGKNQALLVAIVFLLVVICFFVPHFGHNEAIYTVSISSIIAIIAGVPNARVFSFLDSGLARHIGKISYSIYLLHFPIVYMIVSLIFRQFVPNTIITNAILFSSMASVISILLTIPLAQVQYTFIEKHFIDLWKVRSRQNARILS